MVQGIVARIRAFVRRRQHAVDLNAELHDHLEREIARNLERGLSPIESRRAARLAIGNFTMHVEDGRAAVTSIWVEQLAKDIRYAGRALRRNSIFALVAILSLGFGIGATTTVFSTIDALDFRPLPFHDSHQLVTLVEVAPPTDDFCPGCSSDVSALTAIDWLAQARSYSATGVMTKMESQWVHDDMVEELGTNAATPGFFGLLGVVPTLGRDFMPEDTLPGAAPVVIVTHSFWLQRLAGDLRAVGRPLPASFDPATDAVLRGAVVVGVLPQSFRFNASRDRQVWFPLRLLPTGSRTSRSLTVVARLRSDISIPRADAELRVLFAGLAAAHVEPYRSWSARVEPLRARLDWGTGGNRWLLFGITTLVLLVAIVNVAGLMAGRTSTRRQEFAMRSAFGASRRRLLWQLLIEGTSIGLGGGLTGALFSSWGIRLSSAWFDIDTGIAVMDVRVLAFALVLSISVGIVTALGPALRISRVDLVSDLRGHGPTATTRRSGFASSALISTQIAIGLVLLTAAASLSADFVRLRYADLGFDPGGVYATSISLPQSASKDKALWHVMAEEARSQVASIPGVRSATLEYLSAIHPEIVHPIDGESSSSSTPVVTAVDPSYFATWTLPIARGRPFGAADGAGAGRVAIVNRSAASRFWPATDPLGKQVFVGDSGGPGEVLTVIGVSEDAERFEMKERHWPKLYRPLAQATIWHTTGRLQIRVDARTDRVALLALAHARIRAVLQRPAEPFRSVEADLDARLQSRRLNAIILDCFAVFGLGLAAMGVYASIRAEVSRRTREIGLRIALGAVPSHTLRLITLQGIIQGLVGVTVGLLGARAMSHLLQSLVAGSNIFDPWLFAAAAAVMTLTAGVAAWLPARRVLRMDPADVLRMD